jgi:hypothetical protein
MRWPLKVVRVAEQQHVVGDDLALPLEFAGAGCGGGSMSPGCFASR